MLRHLIFHVRNLFFGAWRHGHLISHLADHQENVRGGNEGPLVQLGSLESLAYPLVMSTVCY